MLKSLELVLINKRTNSRVFSIYLDIATTLVLVRLRSDCCLNGMFRTCIFLFGNARPQPKHVWLCYWMFIPVERVADDCRSKCYCTLYPRLKIKIVSERLACRLHVHFWGINQPFCAGIYIPAATHICMQSAIAAPCT